MRPWCRWGSWTAGAGLLALAALRLVFSVGSEPGRSAASVNVSVGAAPADPIDAALREAPPAAGPGPWQLADRALAQAALAEPALAASSPADLQALDRAWCQGGAALFDADTAPIAGQRLPGPAAGASAPDDGAGNGLDGSAWGMQLEAQRRATVQRWVQLLRQQGDDVGLALAELLLSRGLGLPDAPPGQESGALRLARQTRDPLALATALQMPCPGPAGCRNMPIERWTELEPENVFAWLWHQPATGGRWLGESLRAQLRGLGSTVYAQSYRQQALQRLLNLPQTESVGLRQQAELSLLSALYFGWQTPSVVPLVNLCVGAADPAMALLCEQLADRLWGADTLLEQQLAISLVRQLPEAGARPVWMQRAEQVEALLMGSSENQVFQVLSLDCQAQPQMRRQLVRLAELGEARALLDTLRAQGADLPQLAARWRGSQGRSLLTQRAR